MRLLLCDSDEVDPSSLALLRNSTFTTIYSIISGQAIISLQKQYACIVLEYIISTKRL